MMNFINGESRKIEEIKGLLEELGHRRREIKKAQAALPQQIVKKIEGMEKEEAELAKEIRGKAVELDQEVAGEEWKVALTKPREKANMSMLKGFILTHPEAEGLIELGPRTARIVKAQ